MLSMIKLTCIMVPKRGKLTVSPGTGQGHRSISLQAASILASPQLKYSGDIKQLTFENKLTKGRREMITTLWQHTKPKQWKIWGTKANTSISDIQPVGRSTGKVDYRWLLLQEQDLGVSCLPSGNSREGWSCLLLAENIRNHKSTQFESAGMQGTFDCRYGAPVEVGAFLELV